MKTNSNSKQNKILNDFVETKSLLFWICQSIIGLPLEPYKSSIEYWMEVCKTLVISRGEAKAIQYIKQMRLHTTRFLAGSPLHSNTVGVSINKLGLPRKLGPLQELVTSSNPKEIRLLMTLLIISRSFKGGHKEPDYSPITNPPVRKDFEEYRQEIREVLKEMRLLGTPKPIWEAPHTTTKAGPHGQALITSIHDAKVLFGSDILGAVLRLGHNSKLLDAITVSSNIPLEDWCNELGLKPKLKGLRKLSIVHDPEGKCRVIAILDY